MVAVTVNAKRANGKATPVFFQRKSSCKICGVPSESFRAIENRLIAIGHAAATHCISNDGVPAQLYSFSVVLVFALVQKPVFIQLIMVLYGNAKDSWPRSVLACCCLFVVIKLSSQVKCGAFHYRKHHLNW